MNTINKTIRFGGRTGVLDGKNEIDENLWIGDIASVRREDTSDFDRVFGVCQDDVSDNVGCPYEHFPMSDSHERVVSSKWGGDSSYKMFRQAAESLCHSLEEGEKVLVHCHAGVSRSVSVSIAAYGVAHDLSFEEARNAVSIHRPGSPNPRLLAFAEAFIEERG